MRTIILVFVGLLCALIPSSSEGNTIRLKSDRKFRQSTNFASKSLNESQYGNSEVSVDRIVGGVPAESGQFPWMALLGIYKKFFNLFDDYQWICGGSLISETCVVTAAHCKVTGLNRVRIGFLDIDSDDGEIYSIKKLTPHPDYNDKTQENDIMILELSRKVVFTDIIAPCKLPPNSMINEKFDGMIATIAGWGVTKYEGEQSDILLYTKVPIVSVADCSKAYSRLPGSVVNDHNICAGYPQGGKDTCQGDSGGPLMIQDNSGGYYCAGTVSNGYGCAEPGWPGVYTNNVKFLPFIQKACPDLSK